MADDKESLSRAHLPYRAEYCKTSRAKCKKCSSPMEANSLKLATMVKSRFHDGYDASYYHVPCFFQIKRPASVAEIRHFETLKYDDQKMLEKAIDTHGTSVLGTSASAGASSSTDNGSKKTKDKKGKKRTPTDDSVLVNYDDFLIEYAKSNRSKCITCEQNIAKDTVRMGKLDYEADTPWRGGPVPRWYHVECFAKSQEKLGFYGQVEKIAKFDELEEDDRKAIKKKVQQIQPKVIDSKKAKTEKTPEEEEEEKLLKKQSDRFFALREFVNSMKRKDIELMLDHMRQKNNFKAPSMLIDAATDVLLYGPLKKCPECKQRRTMELRGSSYICNKGGEGESCPYETREPKRGVPDIPDELVERYDFFENSYKFRGGKRLFPTKFVKAVEQKEAEDNNIVQKGAPLEGLTIGIISWKSIDHDKSKVQKKITTLGGRLTATLDKSIFVLLSSEDEMTKETPKVEVAKGLNLPFVTADFLFKVEKKSDVLPEVKKCLIGSWDGDLGARMELLKEVDHVKNEADSTDAAVI